MLKTLALALVALFPLHTLAQAGALDSGFNPTDVGRGYGDGANGKVSAVLPLPNGGALIAGSFLSYNGVPRAGIARLLPDGGLDPTFDPGTGITFYFNSRMTLCLQPDGRYVVGGIFATVNGTARNGVARLNTDGSLDGSFDPGTGVNGNVHDMVLQPDGKVLLLGNFSSYNGAARSGLVRIHTDGSVDEGFTTGSGFVNTIPQYILDRSALELLPDGRILVGGCFSSYNGHGSYRVVRLLADGSPDVSFVATGGLTGYITHLLALPGDQVLVNGRWRLNSDGSLDPGFSVGNGAASAYGYDNPMDVIRQPDGRLIAVGEFEAASPVPYRYMIRLFPNGEQDSSFGPALNLGNGGTVICVAQAADGRLWAGGEGMCFSLTGRQGVSRLLADGQADHDFNPGSGAVGFVNTLAQRPDGRLLVGGSFVYYNGAPQPRLVGLLPDGEVDPAFEVGAGFNGEVRCMALQPDGKVVVGGSFTSYQGQAAPYLARLNADGSLDSDFAQGLGGNTLVMAVALQPDGRILVSRGYGPSPILRLLPDGSPDPSFSGPSIVAQTLWVKPDGRILAGGAGFGGYDRALTQLLPDGTVDSDFVLPSPAFSSFGISSPLVRTLSVEPDGHILAGGSFIRFNGQDRLYLVRLHPDGSLDTDYVPATTAWVNAMHRQADGRLIVSSGNTVLRLLPNGAADPSFAPSVYQMQGAMVGYAREVQAMLLQPDGRVVVGGGFSVVNGTGRNRVARLQGDGTAEVRLMPRLLLGGAYDADTQQMRDALREQGLLPTEEPYTALGYAHSGGGGGEQLDAGVLGTSGADAVVDWVLVELRSVDTPTEVLASRSALLQRDGDVVDMDGLSPVLFARDAGTYHVALRHRNHLAVMSATALLLGPHAVELDLRQASTFTYGSEARAICGAWRCLWPGDVTDDGAVKYAGAGNDRDAILSAIGGTIPTATTTGYLPADVNLDGVVRYVGAANDRDPILQTIGGTVPTNVRTEQLP
jgi:uncharacterized delta-60 repeat protein